MDSFFNEALPFCPSPPFRGGVKMAELRKETQLASFFSILFGWNRLGVLQESLEALELEIEVPGKSPPCQAIYGIWQRKQFAHLYAYMPYTFCLEMSRVCGMQLPSQRTYCASPTAEQGSEHQEIAPNQVASLGRSVCPHSVQLRLSSFFHSDITLILNLQSCALSGDLIFFTNIWRES